MEYTVVAAGYIKKVKNILACVDRHGANAVFQGTPYDIKSVSTHYYFILCQVRSCLLESQCLPIVYCPAFPFKFLSFYGL